MGHPIVRFGITALLLAGGAASSHVDAQTPLVSQERPTIGATLPANVLGDLPASNVFAILETTQPEAVTDRFNSGGLNAGEPSRASAFLASWSQTQYRIGDVNIASPNDGTPMLFPEVAFWEQIQATTGLMPIDGNAPGLTVSLAPRASSARWTGLVEGSISRGPLASGNVATTPPPIARLHDWTHGSAVLSGPMMARRLGLVIGGAWSQNTTFARGRTERLRGDVASVFAHAVATPAADTEVRTLAWLQGVHSASALSRAPTADAVRDRAVHVQSTVERRAPDRIPWRVFGGYTGRSQSLTRAAQGTVVVDRLLDGPIPPLVEEVDDREHRWSFGARVSPWTRGRVRTMQIGAELERTGAHTPAAFAGSIGEFVGAVPARVWIYQDAGIESTRQATTFAAFATQRLVRSPLTLDAGLRVESVRGRADGAAVGIAWFSWLPTASLRWALGTPYDLALVSGYRRSANELRLGLLASGDPAAPTATVFRWDRVQPVARVGPGTGGDPEFSRIDPGLRRPVTDEFVIGLESRPRRAMRFNVMGIARRQAPIINVVNTGVGPDGYARFTIPDDNVDLIGTEDDQQLPIYNRLPDSFGRDRYLLTNTGEDAALLGAVVITADVSTDRLFLSIGATAAAAPGPGGQRGYRASENDQDLPGERLTNPNAATYSRGRLFNDRAYTIKWTTVYRFPHGFRLGAIARYQDGQPFARLVIVPNLNQGAEAVQAFANGRSRFAFTGTLDVRVQKGFAARATRLDAILDVYNVLNMAKEVEEYVVTGDRFRTPTALQPPRTVHVGVRLSY